MTQVDFYILDELARSDRFLLACRLAEKAVAKGFRVLIHTSDTTESSKMDGMLWTFKEQGFLPHAPLEEADSELDKITIGHTEPGDLECSVLINLGLQVPSFFSRFERLLECVDNDAAARSASRERYRYYRDCGYPLAVHNIA